MATLQCEKGGFADCEFVEKPPEAVQSDCPICLQFLREPYQAPCCGNSFCRVCIERIKTNSKSCPTCNEENFTTFHNKGLQRSLYGFQVYCSHKQEGCEWKGELGQLDNHLNLSTQPDKPLEGCEYSEIECNYCSELIKRSRVTFHQTEHCDKRPFSCEYCHSYESTYEDVINNHWPVCGYHPVKCPNKCNMFPQRQALENHVTKNCPETVIDCDFHHVGCYVKLPRKDMPIHLNENLVAHMSLQLAHNSKVLTSDIVTELQDKIKKLEKDNETLKHQLREISDKNSHLQEVVVSLQNEVAVTSEPEKLIDLPLPEFIFNFSEVEWKGTGKSEQCCNWLSPPFYTHHKGYKLRFSVTCRSYITYSEPSLDYYDDNVSEHSCEEETEHSCEEGIIKLDPLIMKGEYDNHLEWPFNCRIKVKSNINDIGIHDQREEYRTGKVSCDFTAYRVLTGKPYPFQTKDSTRNLNLSFQWRDFGTKEATICFPQCGKDFRFQIVRIMSL